MAKTNLRLRFPNIDLVRFAWPSVLWLDVRFLWASDSRVATDIASTKPVSSFLTGVPDLILVAIISAITSVAAVVLKDLFFKVWEERRNNRRQMSLVYARYAEPLAAAAESLMWRLNESLNLQGRGRFLLLRGFPSDVNQYSTYGAYKKVSTLYRLAVVLGWLQACKRELSLVKLSEHGNDQRIVKAVADFERSLADGPQVELERLQNLCNLWNLPFPEDKHTRSVAAVSLEACIDAYLEGKAIAAFGGLSEEQKRELVNGVAAEICVVLKCTPVPDLVINNTWSQAYCRITVREAWIYRDWQAAIGDLMVTPAENSVRRFDVIGFSRFETICLSSLEHESKWIRRLLALFDEVDVSNRNAYDYRVVQLKEILLAAAQIVICLASWQKGSCLVSEASIQLARDLVTGGAE
jgi:hypothetical protein